MQSMRTGGYTVVEVFMVITLLAVVAGLMVVPARRIAEALEVRPFESILLAAVREAHMQARDRQEPVVLRCPGETNRLQWCTRDGVLLGEQEIPPSSEDGAPAVRFFRLLPEDPEKIEPAYEAEEDPVEAVLFHPCGACAPFLVELNRQGNQVRLVMDPFSGQPLLREEDL